MVDSFGKYPNILYFRCIRVACGMKIERNEIKKMDFEEFANLDITTGSGIR